MHMVGCGKPADHLCMCVLLCVHVLLTYKWSDTELPLWNEQLCCLFSKPLRRLELLGLSTSICNVCVCVKYVCIKHVRFAFCHLLKSVYSYTWGYELCEWERVGEWHKNKCWKMKESGRKQKNKQEVTLKEKTNKRKTRSGRKKNEVTEKRQLVE